MEGKKKPWKLEILRDHRLEYNCDFTTHTIAQRVMIKGYFQKSVESKRAVN